MTEKVKELFDKKISLINNRQFRQYYITSQEQDLECWDVGLVAFWNTPVLFYELKKAYPNKKFYYVETEVLKDIYGVDSQESIYLNSEEELATIMNKFKNPKLLINPPYSIGGKVISKCKEVCPSAKFSILMPIVQYKTAEVNGHKLYEYVNTLAVVGGNGFDAVITENNCICTLSIMPDPDKTYESMMLATIDPRFKEVYTWNVEHNIGLDMHQENYKKESDFNIDTDFIESARCFSVKSGAGFGKGGFGYEWNVTKLITKEIPKMLGVIKFKSAIAKDNFTTAWYASGKKGVGLLSELVLGVNVVAASAEYYYAIPQISWDNIHINQEELWKAGKYDEAILTEMGLKWEGDTIVKV